jgi:hypothetical protein
VNKSLFSFTKTSWNSERTLCTFEYDLVYGDETFSFTEELEFPIAIPSTYEAEALERDLHIALGISYYKLFVCKRFEVPYELTEQQAAFWNSVWKNGLGEFLYTNGLTHDQLAVFSAQPGLSIANQTKQSYKQQALLGLGGGKDSIVAGELLKQIGIPFHGFVLASGEQLGQTQAVAAVMGVDLHAIKRRIDPKIIDLNKRSDTYNGHIPISTIFALCGSMLAVATNSAYVAVANESSASIPQTTSADIQINHQWSKSLEFERLYQDYLRNNVSAELQYFSVIRPLSSIAVMKLFSSYPEYFEVFTSDNSLFKVQPQQRIHPRWSPQSSKTLSSYLLLAPWLDDTAMQTIFGADYLNQREQLPLLHRLLGHGEPVLDCVGTAPELQACVNQLKTSPNYLKKELVVSLDTAHNSSNLDNFMFLAENAYPEQLKQTLVSKLKELL